MSEGHVRVMQSFRRPKATSNPYIHMLDEALAAAPGIEHVRFSWPAALFGRLDVLHFHWPEVFLEGRTPIHRLVRRTRMQALLLRLRLTRTAIVRTVHNLELPSGISGWDRRMLESIRRRAAVSIALNGQTSVPGTVVVIPHGHYADWFSQMPTAPQVAERVAFVGLVRRYKGVEALIDAFAELRHRRPSATLSISGRPSTPAMGDDVRALTAEVPGVELRLEYLTEPDYALAVTASSLVVLPYVHMHNSGSVLAALSLRRPVLVPDNEVNRALAEEVGEGWIHTFEGTLSGDDIARALDAVAAGAASGAPDLSRRHWADAGTAHADAYRLAARRVRS